MHGSLPTNAFRGLRQLTSNTSCHRCGVDIESDLQTLRDFRRVMSSWMYVSPTYPNNFYTQDYQIWGNENEEIFQNIKKDT